MGYAKYVGRVGALAVALGIGAALVSTGPGMAWAQDEGGDPGSQSQDSTPPGETPGDPTPEPGGDGGSSRREPPVAIKRVNRMLRSSRKRPAAPG